MITDKDIRVTSRELTTRIDEIHARVEVHAVCTLARDEKKVRPLAERRAKYMVWRRLYGDLSDVLAEMETIRLYNVHPHHESRLRELVDKSKALLKPFGD
jgi:Mg2+ and Co2+ transporter CorA